jgi:hypothetical protein
MEKKKQMTGNKSHFMIVRTNFKFCQSGADTCTLHIINIPLTINNT